MIFPATERTGEVTKLDIVEYYLAVEDGIMRALRQRPTTLERWPKGVHPGIVLSTREKARRRRLLPEARPPGSARLPRDRAHRVPLRPHADEICPTEIAVVGWCAQMGTITFHPWPVRSDDVDHPDELRLDLDPQPGTDFDDAVRVAGEARTLLDELGYVGFPKTSGGRGVHIYVRIEPRWTFTDVRHAAIAFGRELERRMPGEVTTKWWKEERGERVFVDYNQNARDRTIASAYSVRPKPGAPVSAPLTGTSCPTSSPRTSPCATMPARFADVGDRHAAIDDVAHSLQPLLDMYERAGRGRHALPARLPEDAGRAQARAAVARSRPQEARRLTCDHLVTYSGGVEQDEVFRALADPTRRSLLDELFERGRPDAERARAAAADDALRRHEAPQGARGGRARGHHSKRGREKLHFLNPVPIRLVHDRWVSKYAEPWAATLTGLKHDLEDRTMEKVFEIYIKTTPGAAVGGDHRPRDARRSTTSASASASDWTPGSRYEAVHPRRRHRDRRGREPRGRSAAPARPDASPRCGATTSRPRAPRA